MKQVSVRSAVSVLTLAIVASVWIQNSTANSEPSASSGRCQGTGEKVKLKNEDRAAPGVGIRGATKEEQEKRSKNRVDQSAII
jgi:hypothetical protein